MAEFFVFVYAMLSGFVLMTMQRNRREQRADAPFVTLVGWGLFSLSSTLALLLGAVVLALALGLRMPLPAGFDSIAF